MYLLEASGFHPDDLVANASRFTLANGLLGCRGTLEECRAEDLALLTMGGIQHRGRDGFTEPVAFPHPFYTYLQVGGHKLHPLRFPPEKHTEALDMESAVFSRETVYQVDGTDVTISSERFLSLDEKNVLVLRYRFTVSRPVDIDLFTGVDARIREGRTCHLDYPRFFSADDIRTTLCPLLGEGRAVAVAEAATFSAPVDYDDVMVENEPLRRYRLHALPQTEYVLVKFAAAVAGETPAETAVAIASRAAKTGYDTLRLNHGNAWRRLWNRADMTFPDQPKLALAMRASIFRMLAEMPATEGQSVAMRGLGSPGLQGAVGWEAELCLLPFYLNVDPDAARRMVMFRVRTLPGARLKAAAIGCRGAFFPLASLADGSDATGPGEEGMTPVERERLATTSIFTSGIVAAALVNYYERRRDLEVMLAGGLELLIECAWFYATRLGAEPERRRLQARGVTGPDAYHVAIDDDALTLCLAAFTMESALEMLKAVKQENPGFVRKLVEAKGYGEALDAIKAALPAVAPVKAQSDFVIEQFPGYAALEDLSIRDLRKRLAKPGEYPGPIAAGTKVLRQADVILLLALFEREWPRSVRHANLLHYEPRTERLSPYSGTAHVLVAASVGMAEAAEHHFLRNANANVTSEERQFVEGLFVGGTYPYEAGAAYVAAVYGFAGLKHHDGAMMCDARLPEGFDELGFRIANFQNIANVTVKRTGGKIAWEKAN